MPTGKPIGARLFLEGREVPLIGATVTSTVDQASIAYIDVVPHQTINDIRPRTLVHLFVRDFYNEDAGYPYVLLFEGEVFGYSYGKTSSSRSMSLSCIDYSSHWDNVLEYFFNAQHSLGMGGDIMMQVGMTIADAIKQGYNVDPVTHSISSYFLAIINKAVKHDGGDFLDGLVAVYKKIGLINDFYAAAEERLRIVDRIVLMSSGQLLKLLTQDQALAWFNAVDGRASGFSTLRQVVQDLMSIIFHDFVSIPCPAKVTAPKVPAPALTGNGSKTRKTIGSFCFKPNLYMMPPPACNVFYPDEYSSFNFTRNFLQEPTRLIYRPEMPRAFAQQGVALPAVYQPDSFSDFMTKKKGSKLTVGTRGTEVTAAQGVLNDPDVNPKTKKNNPSFDSDLGRKRMQQFLTNEEKMKGILIAMESMVPAASQFRQSLSEAGKRTFALGVSRYLFYKKRFQERQLQVTGHLKLSVVPGFPALVLDDSDAAQNTIAYCSSVTHRIYCTQGGYTNTTLSYARTVEEQDATGGNANEPLIPPWFSEELFGSIKTPPASKAAPAAVKALGKQLVVPAKMSSFYNALLGDLGSKVITDLTQEATLVGATKQLVNQYRLQKSKSAQAVQSMIGKLTSRDYCTMPETFGFLRASTTAKDLSLPWLEFYGVRLWGDTPKGGTAPLDASQIMERREVIGAYRQALRTQRGFRG